MRNEPRWIAVEVALRLNAEAVRRTDEPFGVRDEGLLESALAAPANHFVYDGEEDIVALAAVLMVAIARIHPFQQGDKRTAFVVGLAFLDVNGVEMTIDTVVFADLLVGVIEKRRDISELADAMAIAATQAQD